MIFHRALLREFAGLAGAVFMALFAIALTTRLIRLLGDAAGGKIPSDAVVAFMGFFALGALPVLLSLTMFIAVLLTLTRSWRDSELVIWFTAVHLLLAAIVGLLLGGRILRGRLAGHEFIAEVVGYWWYYTVVASVLLWLFGVYLT